MKGFLHSYLTVDLLLRIKSCENNICLITLKSLYEYSGHITHIQLQEHMHYTFLYNQYQCIWHNLNLFSYKLPAVIQNTSWTNKTCTQINFDRVSIRNGIRLRSFRK